MNGKEKIFVIQPKVTDFESLNAEAISLIESADAEYIGTQFQAVKQINPSTYIGSGKLAEINDILDNTDGEITVLFNGVLTPSQTLNISSALSDRKVIDRTTLILDIFARNAVSSEGKIQVELAQLRYIYPRLKGKGSALSRLGGGIGSRGPGESQLETDRRHIRARIKYLSEKLAETEKRRSLQTVRRAKDNVKVIALVGYTNTGKSTLLNALTGSDVLEKDALFATLDPSSRKFIADGQEYLLVDTVGFLRQLPHDIIEAFKSTLESSLNCDLALIVCDATGDWKMQFETTWLTLKGLGFNKKYLKVLNKCEQIAEFAQYDNDFILISAKYGAGLDTLKREIASSFESLFSIVEMFVPYGRLADYSKVQNLISEKKRIYGDGGLNITATVEKIYLDRVKDFIINVI